jgi:thioredoxin reductase (NADPH)
MAAGSDVLTAGQLERLASLGEERTAHAGEILFAVGDATYPFIAILDGEVAIYDAGGREIIRHGKSGFLGEMNLLSGQTVYLTAKATTPLRYVAVEREVFRRLLFDDGALADLVLAAFVRRREALEGIQGVGFEIIGPQTSPATRRIVEFARSNRVPATWRVPLNDDQAAALIADLDEEQLPLVRLPGGIELLAPSTGELARSLGVGRELDMTEQVDLAVIGAGPAGLGAAVYGASEGLDTLVLESTALGGQAGTSRRIENYLGFPGGISGSELATRAVTQARKFNARTATPYRVVSLEPGDGLHVVGLDDGRRVVARAVVIATGAQYRRLPVEDLDRYEGTSVFYAAGPAEAKSCGATRVGVIGGGNSAAQAAIWLARGGALVTLLHRRGDLSETMSDYLIHDLDRFGVDVRGRSEIVALHGNEGDLEAVTLKNGDRLDLSFLFCFLGATPCTNWLPEAIATDADGYILTGPDAGVTAFLQTSVPGIYAAGDARAGSIKRCAIAVGEGAMVIRLIHDHLTALQPDDRSPGLVSPR